MHPDSHLLLDRFPLFRSSSPEEARTLVGSVFSPHRLAMCGGAQPLEVRHNQVRLQRLAINVLSYGAEVEIDPGERGDFYMLQLPLKGEAITECANRSASLTPDTMGVLHPRLATRMRWSADCEMLLLQVPRHLLEDVVGHQPHGPNGDHTLVLSRQSPAVAAWSQAVLDMTRSLHHHGEQWLTQPRAQLAMEDFLVAGLHMLFNEGRPVVSAALTGSGHRALQKAVDYINAHASDKLTVAEIASAACVSPRTLEAAFRRRYDQSPLGYARGLQLDRVHGTLRLANASKRPVQVTDVAMQNGFTHMGRFAGYYKKRFGCTPTQTLKSA
jgi:AraC-like DNA-binding protein